MRQQLRKIYDDLAQGRLSQEEALQRVKTIKLHSQEGEGVLLVTPFWQASVPDVASVPGRAPHAAHEVILVERSPAEVESVRALFSDERCLSLPATQAASVAERYAGHALACFRRLRSILQNRHGQALVQVVIGDGPEDALLVGLSGLLRTAALENPQITAQLLVVPSGEKPETLIRHLDFEKTHGDDALVSYASGTRQVLRWREISDGGEPPPIGVKESGVYLITGGLGGLGLLVAREILAQTRDARVVLAGRSEMNAEAEARMAGMLGQGGRASYRQVDVGDRGQVQELIAAIEKEHGQLNGIVHAAGTLADQFILKKSEEDFSRVLSAKVAGSCNLDEASRHLGLDFFLMFSSIAGAFGNVGQADYASANGFLDQFAVYRNRLVADRQRRGRTRSINWPLWQAGGMGIDRTNQELWQQATGMKPLATATGLRTFHRSLTLPYDRIMVMEGDLARMRRALTTGQSSSPRTAGPTANAEPSPVSAAPAGKVNPEQLAQSAREYLCRQLSEALKVPYQRIDPRAALETYGIDSILAMTMTSRLEATFGPLPKTLFFEYQTIDELARYFAESHPARLKSLFATAGDAVQPIPGTSQAAASLPIEGRRRTRGPRLDHTRRDARPPAPEQERVAIIGLSGRYPEAVDVNAYWANLRDGKDCIIEIPRERWDWRAYFNEDRTEDGHHYSKWGGFISGVDEFDPLFFNISPKDAKAIDPQERLFLQHAWLAMEDAGYTRASLQVSDARDLAGQVGVYAGVMYSEYQLFGAESSMQGKRLGIPNSVASIANRVSYVLNLHGPSMTLDTMCSSSLTAIHLACQDLKQGRTTLAIAGGVNVSIHPNKYLVLSAGQFISSDGHCQSFGEGGDGYIPGEGVGVVILKRLSDATRDGDHIYGVIRGSALTHGGKTNGYTVPNPQAQTSAISRALAESKTDPRHISYIEAHGTGTKLGDPIEIAALSRAFHQYTADRQFCRIGSAKSNIGHCESAAGIAGLTKVLLQMQHRQLVPSLHSAQLNPHIDFGSTPFVVNQSLKAWEPPVVDGRTLPRIAGISSFGAGGSNAHMIVEEYPSPVSRTGAEGPVAVVLSARTADQLLQKAADLLDFVRGRLETIDLASLAFTLQTGREAMDERLGFVVGSAAQLAERLQGYLGGAPGIKDVHRGEVKRNREVLSVFGADSDLQQTVDRWIGSGKVSELLELWVKGLEVDWRRLYGELTPGRMSAPTYPFARERYWVDTVAREPVPGKGAAFAVLHPLLHSNTSDLSQQSFTSVFTGQESFLEDPQADGRRIFPATACLEMARVAVETSAPSSRHMQVEFRHVVFGQPVVVGGPTRVSISLLATAPDQIDFEIYSQEGGDDVVHCQGQAVFAARPAPAPMVVDPLEHQNVHSPVVNMPVVVAEPAGETAIALPAGAREEIAFLPPPAAKLPEGERKRPGGISLVSPKGRTAAATSSAGRSPVTLAATRPAAAPLPRQDRAASPVRLYGLGNGIFSIELRAPLTREVIAHFLRALERVQQDASVKVLLLEGAGSGFGSAFGIGRREAYNDALEQPLYERLISFPYPVVAVAKGDATGTGFLVAALCDFVVLNEDAHYGWADTSGPMAPTISEWQLFAERFGEVLAQDLLYRSKTQTGGELRAKGWTCPIVPAPLVESYAQELAVSMATKAQDALRLLKQHLTRHLVERVRALRPVDDAVAEELSGETKPAGLPATRFDLQTPDEQVLVLRVGNAGAAALAEELDRLWGEIRRARYYKAIVLLGDGAEFLARAPHAIPDDVVLQLQRSIVDSEIPVIAALAGNARGPAWLISQFCDDTVYSRTGVYSSAGLTGSTLAQTAAAVFPRGLGNVAGKEILLAGADYSGSDLERRVGALVATEPEGVLPAAVQLAVSWARLPLASLAAWKRERAAALREKLLGLPDPIAGAPKGVEESLSAGPASIPLRSSVVTATAHPDGIVVVKIEDREAKNMFSDAVLEGLAEAFAWVERTTGSKVVVLTGYDRYFASGGTKESLLAVQQGKVKFADFKMFQLPLDCRLPVIAAMQGHGIGAGWSLGMFADIVLLSEESQYVSPYMDLGFTPGAGATYILADKIGPDLARESLLTARSYSGSELKERGLRLPILPRAEVYPAAMLLAGQIARASHDRLIEMKRQLNHHLGEPLEETYRRELAMHEQTFVGRSDTLARIEEKFHRETAAVPPTVPAGVEAANRTVNSDALPAVTAILRTLLANELLMRESDIDEQAKFVDLGLESIGGVTWVRKINENYRTSIDPTKVYSYPTLADFSRYVMEEADKSGTLPGRSRIPAAEEPPLAEESPAPAQRMVLKPAAEKLTSWRHRAGARFGTSAAPVLAPVRARVPATEGIAVIGIAGQFPQAKNLAEFWENIAGGRNCITQVPAQRWDVNAYYQPGEAVAGKTNSRWVGALDEYDLFDPLFFNISPKEAESMDPQQRLFLQACWHGIENAGYDARSLSGSKCGVFVGCAHGDYHLLSREQQLSAQGFTGDATSILAGRVSYLFNLQGPCMAIDTACSSSLVAIAQACDSLSSGSSDLALAGGVYVMSAPEMHIKSSQVGMLSPDGKCFTFDQRANGFVPGEAVGVVLLKRLADAQRDQDIIHAVIQGWGVNQDGKTNGITAPNAESQTRLEQDVYDRYQIDPANLQLVEAHGTGTKLGDPIEVEGLKKAFEKYTQSKEYCALGSVKSNIGHCLTAAGIAGVTKVILALKHKQLPPTINFERLNEHIDLGGSPFYVNSQLREWTAEPARPRQGAVSAFGFSGTNAHVVIGEYLPPAEVRPPITVVRQDSKIAVPLSARTAAQLEQLAGNLLAFTRANAEVDLIEMAYTLQVGREPMEERLAFLAASVEELSAELEAYLQGSSASTDRYRGQVKRNKEAMSIISQDEDVRETILAKHVAGKKLGKLLELWVKGLELDWNRLYGETKPRRVSLPVYPFAKERYWIDPAAGQQAVALVGSPAAAGVLHPLLHHNTSDLSEQRYSSTFTGQELFLTDRVMGSNGQAGEKGLPAAAYLEMAREAIELALPDRPESTLVELRDITWSHPLVVSEGRQVNVALATGGDSEVEYEIYSQQAGEEIVHCLGHAVLNRQPVPAALDLEQLRRQMVREPQAASSVHAVARTGGEAFQGIVEIHRGEGQLLARLRLPDAVKETLSDYVLHPSLMSSALEAAGSIGHSSESSEPRWPFSLKMLRVVARCSREMFAWVRYSPNAPAGDELDVDLCDETGNLCAQLRGLSWQQRSLELAPSIKETAPALVPVARKEVAIGAPSRREVILPLPAQPVPLEVGRKKPAIALSVPMARASSAAPPAAGRASVTLSPAIGATLQPSTVLGHIRLYDEGNGIFSMEIARSTNGNTPTGDLLVDLGQALDRVQQDPSVKVLMLAGLDRCFVGGAREDFNDAVECQLYRALVSFPYPIIAIMPDGAVGPLFLAGALCDFIVCSEDARYGYTDGQHHLYPTTAEGILFGERFGGVLAEEFLYRSTAATGRELRAKGWTCPILPREEVETYAQQLASTLSTKSQHSLRLLKGHLTRSLGDLVAALAPLEVPVATTEELSAGIASTIQSPAEHIKLEVPAEHVLAIRFGEAAMNDLVADLRQVVADAQRLPYYRAIVLAGETPAFLPGIADDAVPDLQRLLLESEIPVVAALAGDARGNAWLIAQFCDAAVYNREGLYSAASIGPSRTAVAVFGHRFGSERAGELLLSGSDDSGAELERRDCVTAAADRDAVFSVAVEMAASWARMPRLTLAAWKQHTAATLAEKIDGVPSPARWELPDEGAGPSVTAPFSVALPSNVVTVTAHPQGIVVVKMEDREARNMFSDAFVEGMAEAFAHIEESPAYKVVILTGYDTYFASGGTKEGLVAIQQGRAKFTDFHIHQTALECRLPVIAAMQGHGIGAGWSLGMFADVVLSSEESQYVSPYMDYGFTPGAGATYILAEKIGTDLARESLLTARHYTGGELKARAVKLPILPRAEVLPAAMALARQIARASRGRLIALKQQLTAHVRRPLEETYRLEVAMHEQTFVGHADTLLQIQSRFREEEAALPPAQTAAAPAAPASPSGDGDALASVTVGLRRLLSNELRLRESDIDDDVEFVDMGLDSISAVTWMRKINEKYQTSIEATKVYRYPTLNQLSRYVKEEAEKNGTLSIAVVQSAPVAAAKAASTVTAGVSGRRIADHGRAARRRTSGAAIAPVPREAIAVIGMSGRFPQAKNLAEYWANIEQGRNSITEVPASRWDANRYYDPEGSRKDRIGSKWLGVVDDVDRFDPLFFRISPQEAEYMDPQHRLFLEESYKAFEDAGYSGAALSNRKCGVYLGISNNDYGQLLAQNGVTSIPVTSNSFAIAAARIAYYLNLKGPAISVDTACSSSLVSIHLACQALLSGETDMALAGGVTLWLTPESHMSMSEAGMLSPSGQCKTFDDDADGIVVGEGVGALVLKRLKDAQADNDTIYGIILGSGINQDGRTNGITAPSVNSQIELERSIYDKFGIDPATIGYVEAHGTGTKLGDPIELEALAAAFREKTAAKNYCALGSVKSNIGHTASAAGVASVLKVLLSMRHGTLGPTLNVQKENSHFDFNGSPFFICREKRTWEPLPGSLRRAAVSSFGYSGTNAHLVMEEYVPARAESTPIADDPVIVPLSARTAERLQEKARDLLSFVRAGHDAPAASPKPFDLASLAYTLQVGREAMEERICFVVGSARQLEASLSAFVNGDKNVEDIYHGRVEQGSEGLTIIGRDEDMREAVDKWIVRRKLSKLAEGWTRGLHFDWDKLHGTARPRRISLPAYPFARERYWIDKIAIGPAPGESAGDLDMESIEEILSRVGTDALEADRAVQLLRMLV
jgi:acyl transferase domain-containing protein/enoyl-CoA hydratase/carnithine racemase/acyl carrier protein/NADP-dependent 3-hydroxy acid dehydrogenase YdfG